MTKGSDSSSSFLCLSKREKGKGTPSYRGGCHQSEPRHSECEAIGDISKPEGLRALPCLGQDAGGRMSFMVGGPSVHQGREQRLAFLTMVPE